LVPGLGRLSVGGGVEGIKSAGIGLVALVSTPIIALLLAITLVGLLIALFSVFAWLLVLYIAKIAIAANIGQAVFGDSDRANSSFAVLAVGIAKVNLPFVGGIISFVLTIVGIGLIVQYVFTALSTPREAS
jgi:hypothetical protein